MNLKNEAMKTKKLRNKNQVCLHIRMWNLENQGWRIIKQPFKNWFGVWTCKLEKR